jgi:hypothetical protein
VLGVKDGHVGVDNHLDFIPLRGRQRVGQVAQLGGVEVKRRGEARDV